ncbi:MAG: hypothetical protein RLZZ467_863, partial [Gemmatimonadota bacterium]
PRGAWIGDRWHDVAPALVFGGRGLLVPSVETPPDERERAAHEAQLAPDRQAVAAALLPPGCPE